jgi:hypothetical protein
MPVGALSASELVPPTAAEDADPKAGVATLAWPGSLAVPQIVPAEQLPAAAFHVAFVYLPFVAGNEIDSFGAALSYLNVRFVGEFVLPAASVPVTASDAADVVFAAQLKALETYGPPDGVATVEPVKVHPLVVPPSEPNVLDAGPDRASVRAFRRLKLPDVPFAYHTVLPERKDAAFVVEAGPACALWFVSESAFVGAVLSITTVLLSLPVLPAVSLWLTCAL